MKIFIHTTADDNRVDDLFSVDAVPRVGETVKIDRIFYSVKKVTHKLGGPYGNEIHVTLRKKSS